MSHEPLRNLALSRTFVALVSNLSDLIGKEILLARAEIAEKVQSAIRASAWTALAALLCLMAVFFLLEAAVFVLVSFGLAVYWACLIVAGTLAIGGVAALACGRSAAPHNILPTRSIKQIGADIRTAKEFL
jgi:uncharacterized membrane protein YgcG